MKNLMICETPFQLMTILTVMETLKKEDSTDLIIVDRFSDYKNVAESIRRKNIFSNVYIAKLGNINSKIQYTVSVLSSRYMMSCCELKIKDEYGAIYVRTCYSDLNNAIAYICKSAKIIIFDEGYSTYTSDMHDAYKRFSYFHKIIWNASKKIHKNKSLESRANSILLYDSRLCVFDIPYEIMKIEVNEQIKKNVFEILRSVFNTVKARGDYKDKKYIFFEECFAEDFGNNGDEKIIQQIADIVGKDNIIIKLHPRDKTDRFKKLGFFTNKDLSIPAEVLISEFIEDKKVFITFSSGSVLNYKFFRDENIKTILLYKLYGDSFVEMPEDRIKWFEKYIIEYGKDIYVPKSIEELKKVLMDL